MTSIWHVILTAIVAVVVYDALAAMMTLKFGYDYASFSYGSLLIYLAFGFIAGRIAAWSFGALVGAVTGLTDSTLGWWVSWMIGPGKPAERIDNFTIVTAIVFVTSEAAIVGLIGGLLSLATKRSA